MLSLSRIPPDLIARYQTSKQTIIYDLSYAGRAEVGRMQRSDEICGELNPGFNLWTSAHGFHHFRSLCYKSVFGFFNFSSVCLVEKAGVEPGEQSSSLDVPASCSASYFTHTR